jgi:hypothetical protein
MTSLPRHTCHAKGCAIIVPPAKFMCLRHWRMVPGALQAAIWAAYVPGQEIRKDPTPQYLEAALAAQAAVASTEEARNG